MGNNLDKIDRHMLHEFLWKYRDRNSYIPWQQKEVAKMFGVNHCVMSVIYKELLEQKALKKEGSKFRVSDPSLAVWEQEAKDSESRLF